MIRTDTATRETLRNAIFAICGSRNPTRGCLDRIGREAAQVAGRRRPWTGAWLYTLITLDLTRYNNGRVKYGINSYLLSAVLQLAKREATIGKRPVMVYGRHLREGAVVFGRARKCARRRCGVWFVSDNSKRAYCSDSCCHRVEFARRKRQAQARRREKIVRRRKGERQRSRKR